MPSKKTNKSVYPIYRTAENNITPINFDVDALLTRRTSELIDDETRDFYKNKVVLITGGGGTIGSELSRQIAACSPRKLVIFDIYENNAYDVEQELVRKYGKSLDLSVVIGSVQDNERVNAVFSHYRPDIVFHAAAHKHVPLMQASGAEAVKNNCFGTYNVCEAAEKYGAEKFLLISTDKAVDPVSIMGATKRMCEMITLCRTDSKTRFCAVRFGNVLGSNGSVIPLFLRQISEGGPVTVTDKGMTRFFMTVKEAVRLVTEAAVLSVGGDLFALDMGEPIRIYDLALEIIKLSGLTPYEDIDVVEIGLRPGEKLTEERLVDQTRDQATVYDGIYTHKTEPLSRDEVDKKLDVLRQALAESKDDISSDRIDKALSSVVPSYIKSR